MVSLIIALYNEHGRLAQREGEVLEFLASLEEPWELILVDDGSTDGAVRSFEALALRDARVRVLSLGRNLGQGAALKLGFGASKGDILLYTDADLPIPLAFCRVLMKSLSGGSDLAIASRWCPAAEIGVPQPRLRRVLGRVYYWIVRRVLLDGIHDTNCGLKAYRGEAGRRLFGLMRSRRWAFNVEHLWLAKRLGYRVAEIPTRWNHRDESKVRLVRDCAFTLWELLLVKARQAAGVYPAAASASKVLMA